MSVPNIATAKEQAQTYQPLLLAEISFYNYGLPSAVTYRLASHMLSGTSDGGGGFAYGGHDYDPRILNTEDLISQLLSDQGIDYPPSVSIVAADPDSKIWTTYELPIGFKGAQLVLRFVFWDADTSSFSPDSITFPTLICERASAPGLGQISPVKQLRVIPLG